MWAVTCRFGQTSASTAGRSSPPRTARSLARHPADAATLARWASRFLRRAVGALTTGPAPGNAARLLPTTYVLHRFMDAGDVRRAWDLMERGVAADEPTIRETQERLAACAYGMAHPETDRVVPACVQHGVLDQGENQQLLQLLPTRPPDDGRPEASVSCCRPSPGAA